MAIVQLLRLMLKMRMNVSAGHCHQKVLLLLLLLLMLQVDGFGHRLRSNVKVVADQTAIAGLKMIVVIRL